MDTKDRYRLNRDYVQAVLAAGRPPAAWHVMVSAVTAGRRYQITDPEGQPLKPAVSGADVVMTRVRSRDLVGLERQYAELLAAHRRASDDPPQLELSRRPAAIRRKVVMNPAHTAFLRGMDEEAQSGSGLSR